MRVTVLDGQTKGSAIYIVVTKGNYVKVGWAYDLNNAKKQAAFPEEYKTEEVVIRVDL